MLRDHYAESLENHNDHWRRTSLTEVEIVLPRGGSCPGDTSQRGLPKRLMMKSGSITKTTVHSHLANYLHLNRFKPRWQPRLTKAVATTLPSSYRRQRAWQSGLPEAWAPMGYWLRPEWEDLSSPVSHWGNRSVNKPITIVCFFVKQLSARNAQFHNTL